MKPAQKFGLFFGPILFGFFFVYPWLFGLPAGLSLAGMRLLGVIALMAVWWVTEAIPIPATSLLPIALFPLLKIMKSADVTKPYANHIIYLFIGGFILARGIEKWNLHRRIALLIIRLFGTRPERIILGFMVATALLSMWVSNTATVMMMLPIGLSVVGQIKEIRKNPKEKIQKEGADISTFATALMLGIAYAASIGGLGTIIGTPPNALLVGFVEQKYGQHISFLQWMAFGIPLALIFLILAWILLVKVLFKNSVKTIPGGKTFIQNELQKLGKVSREERLILAVFIVVAAAWIARGFLNTKFLGDDTIAMMGAVALFIIPSDFKKGHFLMDWKTAVTIPWGVIILFGGGLALAAGVTHTGLDQWISGYMSSMGSASLMFYMILVIVISIIMTEFTSNTATASLLIPLAGAAAIGMHFHPYALMIATCVSTSYAFMLPVATPPNAVVFGSGYVSIYQMAKTGVWLNLVGILLILIFTYFLLPFLWGINLHVLPLWAQ